MSKQEGDFECFAIWACGAPASGKSRICEAAVIPMGFELIDVDKTYEELLIKYKLSCDHITDEENSEPTKAIQYTRRMAEKLAKEESNNGLVDPDMFIARMKQAVHAGKLKEDFADPLADKIRRKVNEPIPCDSFLKAFFPKMCDYDDPLDYLKNKKPVNHAHILAVAREITRRHIINSRNNRGNLLFVETGGQTGRLINMKKALTAEGYRTFLLWIYVKDLNELIRRNNARKTLGGRGLDLAIIKHSFQVALRTREKLLIEFHPNAAEIDNEQNGTEYILARIKEIQSIVRKWMAG
jgi:hypothetical protein